MAIRSTQLLQGLVAILFLTLGCSGVFAGEREAGMTWILTGDSAHLDRSTRFLANGYHGAAVRHAEKALRKDTTPLGQLLANHNICIGLTLAGESGAADQYCRRAAELEVPMLYLSRVEGRFMQVKSRPGAGFIELRSAVSHNLELLGATPGVEQLALMR